MDEHFIYVESPTKYSYNFRFIGIENNIFTISYPIFTASNVTIGFIRDLINDNYTFVIDEDDPYFELLRGKILSVTAFYEKYLESDKTFFSGSNFNILPNLWKDYFYNVLPKENRLTQFIITKSEVMF